VTISSYKHILKANSDAKGNIKLTPDEKQKLAQNFTGYDISPDMVRLSLVNMYLHGFVAPRIHEYDTLTSQDKWNEYADVILANPPFMSPKGGIKPHNRFTVQSKRSEVLFVDYMAEHLTSNGRAGIIVPEGVIFQSQNAYKQLRKMLVEDHLIGVISLPSGVFMPYTGVKTSILVLDRLEARRNPSIMFSDVREIGFSLGVKRTPTENNDLPCVLSDFRAYYSGGELSRQSWLAPRDAILANGVSLTGSKYRKREAVGDTRWVVVGEACTITKGASSSTETPSGPYPLVVRGEERLTSSSFQFDRPAICVPSLSLVHGKGQINRLHYCDGQFAVANLMYAVQPNDADELDPLFLFHVLSYRKDAIAELMQGAIYVTLKAEDLATFEIPLPPMEVQKEIVAEIEGYQKVIDGARAVLDNYRPHIPIHPDWPTVKLGEIFDITSSKRVFEKDWRRDGVPFYRAREIVVLARQGFVENELFISEEMFKDYSSKYGAPEAGDLMVTGVGTLGICYEVKKEDRFYFKDGNIIWLKKRTENSTAFIKTLFLTDVVRRQMDCVAGAVVGTFTIVNAKNTLIPLPPLDTQRAIVAEIEAEQALVAANRELIARMEKKIESTLARVWGEEKTDAEAE